MLLSSTNKLFRADPNYIKEMQTNWETFVMERDKKFYLEIRVILMKCLFDLSLMFHLDLVSKMFSSVSFSYKNYKRER